MIWFVTKYIIKKSVLEDSSSSLEYRCVHTFRLIDQPRTGTINSHKLSKYLSEVQLSISSNTVERIAEMISTTDEAEFTEEDLVEFIRDNLKMAQGVTNSMKEEESVQSGLNL